MISIINDATNNNNNNDCLQYILEGCNFYKMQTKIRMAWNWKKKEKKLYCLVFFVYLI